MHPTICLLSSPGRPSASSLLIRSGGFLQAMENLAWVRSGGCSPGLCTLLHTEHLPLPYLVSG